MAATVTEAPCRFCGRAKETGLTTIGPPKSRPDGVPGRWSTQEHYDYLGREGRRYRAVQECACGYWNTCGHFHEVEQRAVQCAERLNRRSG